MDSPQAGHVKNRSPSPSWLRTVPHREQVLELGKNRSARSTGPAVEASKAAMTPAGPDPTIAITVDNANIVRSPSGTALAVPVIVPP